LEGLAEVRARLAEVDLFLALAKRALPAAPSLGELAELAGPTRALREAALEAFAEPVGARRQQLGLLLEDVREAAKLGVVVDLAAKRVIRDAASGPAADIRLTPTEWHLLEVLLRHPGKLLGQQYLLKEVWGPGYADATGNLRLYMAQLRRKLEPDPARPRWLLTEPGMGYRFQPDPDAAGADGASIGGHVT